MPFKQPRSPYYYIEITRPLPGYGPFPRRSTGLRRKGHAREAESLLHDLAERGLTDPSWYVVIEALSTGDLGFGRLLRAKQEGTLVRLRSRLKEPTLEEAVALFLKTDPTYGQRLGLTKLERLARAEHGSETRLSDLDGRALTLIAHRAKREGGKHGRPLAHNTVIRGVLNSASLLIKFHLGQFERDRIFADVRFSHEEDRREVSLGADEVQSLLAACSRDWLRVMVTLALATSAERGVLLEFADAAC